MCNKNKDNEYTQINKNEKEIVSQYMSKKRRNNNNTSGKKRKTESSINESTSIICADTSLNQIVVDNIYTTPNLSCSNDKKILKVNEDQESSIKLPEEKEIRIIPTIIPEIKNEMEYLKVDYENLIKLFLDHVQKKKVYKMEKISQKLNTKTEHVVKTLQEENLAFYDSKNKKLIDLTEKELSLFEKLSLKNRKNKLNKLQNNQEEIEDNKKIMEEFVQITGIYT
jgi:hypothetical protein